MSATTGIMPIGDYTTPVGDVAKVNALLALIPNPDSTSSSGAIQGPKASYLDEMSPGAAAQLRVEIMALAGKVT